jgi:hypothetical protein
LKDWKFLAEKYLQGKHRPFQPPNEPAVRKAFEQIRGDVFVDIGANAGYYTIRYAKNFDRVFAVEPEPYTINELYRRLKKKALAGRVTVKPYRLGRIDGEREQLDRTFDTLFYPLDVTLVKMDVEKAEFDVLEGMKMSLATHRVQNMMIELHLPERAVELVGILTRYGFSVQQLDQHPRFMARLS